MTANLKPYPNMKDSGVEWLGDVPTHWEVRRLSQIGTISKGRGGNRDDEVAAGIPCVRYGDLYTTHDVFIGKSRSYVSSDKVKEYTTIKFGDVLFAGSGETIDEIGKSAVNLMRQDACCGGDVILFRPAQQVEAGYLGHALDCRPAAIQKATMGRGTTIMHIYGTQLKYLTIPLPPLAEQAAIVRFLDYVDRRIRRYIRAKCRLIVLLEEMKQAVIDQAITGQIDVRTSRPYSAYKPSGVAALGDVPEPWAIRRFKSLVARIEQGVSPQAENYLAEGDAWGVLKASCVNGGVFREREHKRLAVGFAFNPNLAVRVGDVLVSRASGSTHLVGSAGRVSSLTYRLILSDKTFRPVFAHEVDPEFMVFAMNSRCYRRLVEQAISGAEGLASNLPLSALRGFHFAVPTLDEQRDIARHLLASVSRIDGAVARVKRETELVTDIRDRLIADVVTGRIDVREAWSRPPSAALRSANSLRNAAHDDVRHS